MKRLLIIAVLLSIFTSAKAVELFDNEDDTIYQGINLNQDFLLFMPTAFSPNGDGMNDFFAPMGAGITFDAFEMRIYNRMGCLVYLSTDINHPWDGDVAGKDYDETTTEVFAYHITVRTTEGAGREYFGHVLRIP